MKMTKQPTLSTGKLPAFISLVAVIVAGASLVACDDDDDSNEPGPQGFGQRNMMTLMEFYDGLEREDVSVFEFLAEDVTDNVRLNPNGTPEPVSFNGRDEVVGFINTIFQSFDNISFNDRRLTVSEDGNTVFIQTVGGAWTFTPTGGTYQNVYIFRVDFNEEGQIEAIEEYLNWVVNSEVAGVPLGSCGEVICQ